jgi:hypothetical protein
MGAALYELPDGAEVPGEADMRGAPVEPEAPLPPLAAIRASLPTRTF